MLSNTTFTRHIIKPTTHWYKNVKGVAGGRPKGTAPTIQALMKQGFPVSESSLPELNRI